MNTYVIVDKSDFFDEIVVGGITANITKQSTNLDLIFYNDQLATSTDGTKALLKYRNQKPSCFDGLITYNEEEILAEMAKSEWN